LYRYESYTPEDTFQLGFKLGSKLKGGEVIALEGELGAGKTLFVKGLAAGLGADEPVTSPTFTLINIYQGRLPLAHFDVYRIPAPEAIEELGYDEFFYGTGVTAVEWSDLIQSYLPAEHIRIRIRREYTAAKGEYRIITLSAEGPYLERLLKELDEDVGTGN